MEYRKKHLTPKINIDSTLKDAFKNDAFMQKIDFISSLRKNVYINQNKRKIKAIKPCTITSEGLTIYMNHSLKQFVDHQESKLARRRPQLLEVLKKLNLSQKNSSLKDSLISELYQSYKLQSITQLQQTSLTNTDSQLPFTSFNETILSTFIGKELLDKAQIQSEQLTMNELRLLFQQRAHVFLQLVHYDRNKQSGSPRKMSPGEFMMSSIMSKNKQGREQQHMQKDRDFQIGSKLKVCMSETESQREGGE